MVVEVFVIVVLLLLSIGNVWAKDVPYRCEAVWLQPTKLCPLESTWAATGTGSSESKARDAAVDRMRALLGSAAMVQSMKAPSRPVDSALCKDEVEDKVRISCLPAPDLVKSRVCYIDFPRKECGNVQMFERSGPPWRVMEKGRDQICSKVDVLLRQADMLTRHDCRSSCLQDARVRCPQ